MATWKKLVVSGSDISQLNNDAGYISASQVPAAGPSFSTASINGVELLADSPSGSFSIVTGSAGTGLTIVGNAGSDTITFDLSAIPNATLANDDITIGTTAIALGDSSTTLAGLTSVTSTGFTGSLSATSVLADGVTATTQSPGDNSTKVATTAYVDAQVTAEDLDIAGDGSTTTAVDLDSQTLTFTGNDGIALSASAQTITATINDGGIANAKLANSSLTVTAGDGLAGGGSVSLGGSTTVSVDTGSAHFIGGARKSISVSDTTGANGIDLTYTEATGVLSGVIQNSFIGFTADSGTPQDIDLGTEIDIEGGSNISTSTAAGKVVVALDSNITVTSASGSFSGSFEGDGSGLTGIASTLNIDSDAGGPSSVDLLTQTLDIAGGSNISTSVSGQTVTVALDSNITVTDAIIQGDLTVLGTASFNHETNLEVADRFILLASGSTSTGDGGIIIQQATQDLGEVFGFDGVTGATRWGIGQNQHASGSSFTPDAFMAAVLSGNASSDSAIDALVDARYQAKGNLFIGDDQDIWIWS